MLRPFSVTLGIALLLSLMTSGSSCLGVMHKAPNPCDVTGDSWIPYTGYRIQREITLTPVLGQSLLSTFFSRKQQYDTISHVVVTKCDRGHIKYEAISKIENDGFQNGLSKNMWNTTVCTTLSNSGNDIKTAARSKGYKGYNKGKFGDSEYGPEKPDCYRMARRLKYLQGGSEWAMSRPGNVVGGLFECRQRPYEHLYSADKHDPQCTRDNTEAILPLVADKPYHVWSKLDGVPKQGGGFSVRIPLFFTPDLMHKQYPRVKSEWAPHPGTVQAFKLPFYLHSHYLDESWASHIDPFEEYVPVDLDAGKEVKSN